MTPQEALARIAYLCDMADAHQPERLPALLTSELRAVLAEVSVLTPEESITVAVIVRDRADVLAMGGDIQESDRLYALADAFRDGVS